MCNNNIYSYGMFHYDWKDSEDFSISCHRDYKGPATLFIMFSFTLPLTESYVSISSGELLLLSSISIFLLCFPNNYLAPLFVYSFSIKVMLRIYCEHFCYASSWWCNLWTYIHNIYILRFLLYFNLVLVDILPWAYLWFVWL